MWAVRAAVEELAAAAAATVAAAAAGGATARPTFVVFDFAAVTVVDCTAVEQLADIRRGLDACASPPSAPSINGAPSPQLVPCFCGAEPALVRKLRAAGCIARGDRVEADARAARRWCEDELLSGDDRRS